MQMHSCAKGHALFLALVLNFAIFTVALLTVRFIAERRLALKELRQVELELHQKHKEADGRPRHWEVIIDHPDRGPHHLSPREHYRNLDHIYADF